MDECEQLRLRVRLLERDAERKQALIEQQADKLDRLTAWIDAMLAAAEARQDELVARNDHQRS